MKSKQLIELRELDYTILNCLNTKSSFTDISFFVFPNAKYPKQSLLCYIRKYLSLGLIYKTDNSYKYKRYSLTYDGEYFLNKLDRLINSESVQKANKTNAEINND